MILPSRHVLWFISLVRLIYGVNVVSTEENGGQDFLGGLNENSAELASKLVRAQWVYETNNTENAKNELVKLTSEAIKSIRVRFQKVLNVYPWQSFSNPDVRRQLKFFSEIGTLALPDEEYNQFEKIISDLDVIQQNTTICDYYNTTKCDLHYSDVKEKLETSQNSGELSYLWTEWREATEPKLKKLLESYVKLCNQAAVLNNYRNYKEYSLRNIESKDIKEEMITLWEDIKPLYSQMHAYVRRKLRDIYGEKIVPRKGPIPIYLLGNVWSENWSSQRMVPFPERDNFNFTSTMISQGFTPERVRKVAEDFLVSMNFSVPPNIWVEASDEVVHRNTGKCHPKIFNFYSDGVRIKNCEKVSLKDYLEDIRLLTKAEYVLQYKDQPYIYQTPADPGLEEAMSNVMTMSASTFNNLKKLDLYKGEFTEEVRLNRLFKLALEKLTSLTFLLVQEFWRWDVYSGKALDETATTMNDLREKFQGISTFTKELTFDPGGIGSAFSKLSLSHHFLGNFLQFQLYESLCKVSKTSQRENDLTECNLYENAEAGRALRTMMSMGFSRPLTETFSSVLGISKISSESILKYFDPLMKWLEKENEMTGEYVGWDPKDGENPPKTRRKRSMDDYPSELKDEDSDIAPSKEPDRFQRLVYKRSKNNQDNPEVNVRERKSTRFYTNTDTIAKDGLLVEERPGRKPEESAEESYSTKNRRTSLTKLKSGNKHSRQITPEEDKAGENAKESKESNPRNVKRHLGFETLEQTYIDTRPLEGNAGDSLQEKRSFDFGGNSEEDFKSTVTAKNGNYEALIDYSRMKPADGRDNILADKGSNKLWSLKSFLTDAENNMSPSSLLEKKENLIGSHLAGSMLAHATEEKTIGKKETSRNEPEKEAVSESSEGRLFQSGDPGLKRVNIDIPSLQALLQKADMNAYQPRPMFSLNPDAIGNRDQNEMGPMYANSKLNPNNRYANYFIKYTPPGETLQYKEGKEFRDGDVDNKGNSPYILILGESSPEMKEKFQDDGVNFREVEKQSMLQGDSHTEEEKMSEKRSRASDQIYIVPIYLKNSEQNLIKPNHYSEYEHEAGHDPNTERDQESEQQIRLDENSKSDESGNFYKTGKDGPSEFIISWNNDKTRKIVKRSKREHKKDVGDDKMKVVRIAPVKDSFLEGLLGKSLDRASLDDKDLKILIHDGQLNSEPSQISSSSSNSPAASLSGPDETDPLQQRSSPLSSLASNVLTALTPKGLSQLVKASSQHQDLDMDEESLKEVSNAQPFVGKKKSVRLHSEEDNKSAMDADQAAKGDEACCKKIILTPCPPRCPPPCPPPCPCPCPIPCPCPCPPPPCPCPQQSQSGDDSCRKVIECPPICCKTENQDLCCKKPSECSLVNCQFKITKAKKPHERLTIMIYDRINPPAELPEPYDALAVISEILQRIQCCPCKPSCQLTEEDPDYPANDNSDQLKGNPNPPQDKSKIQELSGEIPIMGNESPEDEESDENSPIQMQNSPSSVEEERYQPKEKATPALDQLTVFNKDKLKPVFFEFRKIDDLIKKRSQKE